MSATRRQELDRRGPDSWELRRRALAGWAQMPSDVRLELAERLPPGSVPLFASDFLIQRTVDSAGFVTLRGHDRGRELGEGVYL